MKASNDKILVIASYTKRLGFAVFDKTELLYFAVKTFKSPRANFSVETEISRRIATLQNEFRPQLVIVKTLGLRQAESKRLKLVASRISQEAHARNLPLQEISFEQASQALCSDKKTAKTDLFKMLSGIYPEIKRFTIFHNHSQAEYYNSLLSAVAIGFYHQTQRSKITPETELTGFTNRCPNKNNSVFQCSKKTTKKSR